MTALESVIVGALLALTIYFLIAAALAWPPTQAILEGLGGGES